MCVTQSELFFTDVFKSHWVIYRCVYIELRCRGGQGTGARGGGGGGGGLEGAENDVRVN